MIPPPDVGSFMGQHIGNVLWADRSRKVDCRAKQAQHEWGIHGLAASNVFRHWDGNAHPAAKPKGAENQISQHSRHAQQPHPGKQRGFPLGRYLGFLRDFRRGGRRDLRRALGWSLDCSRRGRLSGRGSGRLRGCLRLICGNQRNRPKVRGRCQAHGTFQREWAQQPDGYQSPHCAHNPLGCPFQKKPQRNHRCRHIGSPQAQTQNFQKQSFHLGSLPSDGLDHPLNFLDFPLRQGLSLGEGR